MSGSLAFSAAFVAVTLARVGLAQTARIDVTHDDADGVVLPGETARVRAVHSRDNGGGPWTYLGRVAGDLRSSPGGGVASAFSSPYVPSTGLWFVQPGVVIGGSVLGFDVNFFAPPVSVMWHPPQWGFLTMELLSTDWTAPSVVAPTVFEFAWDPSPAIPQIQVWANSGSSPFPVPTTYHSTSILVLPSPSTLAVLVVAGAGCSRRRRRA